MKILKISNEFSNEGKNFLELPERDVFEKEKEYNAQKELFISNSRSLELMDSIIGSIKNNIIEESSLGFKNKSIEKVIKYKKDNRYYAISIEAL